RACQLDSRPPLAAPALGPLFYCRYRTASIAAAICRRAHPTFEVTPMKIAIVHDWLVTYAGAERVLAALCDTWPEADLFAVIDFLSDEDRARLGGKRATTTFIQQLPKAKTHYQKYLPLMPLAIEQLDMSAYDLVISSS